MRSPEDKAALENSLMAIDASVRTLMLARTVIVDRLDEDPTERPGDDKTATFGDGKELPACEHYNVQTKALMGSNSYWCPDCGAMLTEDGQVIPDA